MHQICLDAWTLYLWSGRVWRNLVILCSYRSAVCWYLHKEFGQDQISGWKKHSTSTKIFNTIITWISRRSIENHDICSSELLFHNHGSRLITWSSILWFLMTLFILCVLSFILLIFDKSSLCYWIADWYSLQFSHSCLYCLLIHYISFHDILQYSMD